MLNVVIPGTRDTCPEPYLRRAIFRVGINEAGVHRYRVRVGKVDPSDILVHALALGRIADQGV